MVAMTDKPRIKLHRYDKSQLRVGMRIIMTERFVNARAEIGQIMSRAATIVDIKGHDDYPIEVRPDFMRYRNYYAGTEWIMLREIDEILPDSPEQLEAWLDEPIDVT